MKPTRKVIHKAVHFSNVTYELSYNNFDIILNTSPLANCQLFTIGNFNQLLVRPNEIIDILKYINEEYCDKPMLVIDVYRQYLGKVKKIFETVFITEYTNKTGSKMLLAMIDLPATFKKHNIK